MRHVAYFAFSIVLVAFLLVFLSACGSHQSEVGIVTSGGAGGSGTSGVISGGTSGVISGGTSGGTTSGGTTSGGTTSGGTTSGGGGSGGSAGGSGGSAGAMVGPAGQNFATPDSGGAYAAAFPSSPYQGVVNGGQSRAVVGARVYVLQVNSGEYGNSSVSLLTSATGSPADSIGHYVLSGEHGGFSIAGNYTCTAGHEVYVYVRGGNSGGDGPNSAIGLMASLGACPDTGHFDNTVPFIFVNEVTTVAAAYAMSGMAADATHVIGSQGPSSSNEFANAADLASITTGFANSTLPFKPDSKLPQTKIHTLANILSACINSDSPMSATCTTLFANARRNGSSGTLPDDTATAAINIARNPHANIAALYGLQPKLSAPFEPALESAPPDFDLAVASEDGKPSVASISFQPWQ